MESKTQKTIAIIGGGYSGLATGIFAQLAGFKSKIFEHNFVCGGLAAAFNRKEYHLDDGTHYIMGYKEGPKGIKPVLDKLGIGSPDLYTPMKNFVTFMDENSGVEIPVDIDLEKVRNDCLSKAPEESAVINEFFDILKAFRDNYPLEKFAEKAPDSMGLLDKVKFYFAIRNLLFYFIGKHTKIAYDYVKDIKTKWVAEFIRHFFNEETVMYLGYITLGTFFDDDIAYITNGCDTLINKMVERYKALGGEIKTKATVTKILVENNKAVGIKLKNGDEFKSDIIISTGDLKNTIYNLLEKKYTTEELEKRCNMPPMKPTFFATYGVKKEFKDAPIYVNLILKEPIKYGPHSVDKLNIRFCNYGSFAPAGKTMLQGMYKCEPGYWEELHEKDVELYKKEKERVANEILDRMEKHWPGIKENIEVKDVATPYTTIRYTLHKNGSMGGCRCTDEILKNKANHKIPNLDNFYLAGHWIYSMGVVPALLSGRNVVDLIKEDLDC